MKIAIIGAGNLGTGLAKHLVRGGHQVFLSFSRNAEETAQSAGSIGAQSGTPSEATMHADVVVLAPPWTAVGEALQQAGPLDGKVIWDCTNPLNPDLSGLLLGTTTSAGEEVARLAPSAHVVKAIPPFAEILHGPPLPPGTPLPSTFVCGDDAEAKRVVSELVSVIGAEPVDSGPLAAARFAEPAAMLLVHLAYRQGMGGRIGARFFRIP
jgi:8-hydroxy-5-deazaflavin:NADPH oxidoreductase